MNDLQIRWKNHVNSKKCPVLNAAIKKYGKENFIMEEIDRADSLEKALHKETQYIKDFNSLSRNGMGYNLTEFTEAFLYDDEVKNKMIQSKKENKKKNFCPNTSRFLGVHFNKKIKRWQYSFRRNGINYEGSRYGSEINTAIARDIKLTEILNEKDCRYSMNFPENYFKYISGEIKMPDRVVLVEFHQTDFNFIYFNKRDNTWNVRVPKPNEKPITRGSFLKEEEAAEMADFLNLKHLGDLNKLNFPDKLKYYARTEYYPPLTEREKKASSPFSNIYYERIQNKFYYRVNFNKHSVRLRPVFNTLREALLERNKIVENFGFKKPIDRPELITINNLDPEIWVVR